MKKYALFILIIVVMCAFALISCAPKKVDSAVSDDVVDLLGTSNSPSEDSDEVSLSPALFSNTLDDTDASVTVGDTAAYVFDGADGITLYGAAEYTNSSDYPIRLTNAKFVFDVSGSTLEKEFVPEFSEYVILNPGETSFITLWTAYDAGTAGEAVTLTAQLTAEKTNAAYSKIDAANLYVADNYPTFATLSGTLTLSAGNDCTLNVIYVGFYDANADFLGAWYFTKDAHFENGTKKDFVVHMRELPIDNLSQLCASIKAAGFGFAQ